MNLIILLKVFCVRWIKVACQSLARFTARVLLRYRPVYPCFRKLGVVRDENAILI
jgi:hypothetical protein